MAQVPYNEGIPSVAPQVNTPDDYSHVQASPASFGAGAAQGLGALGTGAEKAGDFFGQVQTDDALNGAMKTANEKLEQYKGLRGRDRLDAQDSTNQAIDEAFKTARDNLDSPKQQYQFDQTARFFRERYIAGQMSAAANEAAHEYSTGVNNSAYQNGMALISANPSDPAAFEQGVSLMQGARLKNLQLNGMASDPDSVTKETRQTVIDATEAKISALIPTDPIAAQKTLETNRSVLAASPNYDALSSRLQNATIKIKATQIGDEYLGRMGVTGSAGGPVLQGAPATQAVTDTLVNALHQQESGGNDTAPTSAAGAVGGYQIKPATFSQYTHPGENLDINNPADQRTVASRIVEDGLKKSGGNPAGAAVAYISGIGNVAPPGSPTPWKADLVDPNTGISTSQYVSQVSAKAAKAGMMMDKATALAQIDRDYGNDPALAQAVRNHVSEQFSIASIAQQSQIAAQKAASDQSLRTYGDRIRSGATDSAYRRDPNLTEEQVEHLDKLQSDTVSQQIQGAPGNWGGNYPSIQDRILNPGAENPITSRSQLLAEYGKGGLNPAGMEQAGKLLDWSTKPENMGDRLQAENFYKTAQRAVTLEVEGMNIKLPGSDQKWASALPVLNNALDKGRAAGVSDRELMDPKSAKSVWPALQPFLPSDRDKMAFAINAGNNPQPAPAFDYKTLKTLPDAVQAYNDHKITRAQAKELWEANGWGPSTAQPSAPISVK